ncbi:MAG: phosphoribosylformylglycinamidine cyclo-ligase [Planctomycetes bacterium]|nr:phosphoribosylformylglycinamidine cyclo-ligase [Planctomycetota bacterium]
MKLQLSYKDAGVDTARKDVVIDEIIRLMKRTYDPRVIDLPWGFGGLFALSSPGKLFAKHYKSPVLVSCTDGVGTKLKIAFMLNKHDTVGIDLVAMSINDLIVQGAEPLFFLDYISIGKVNENVLIDLVKGIVTGCEQAGCALLGGETAEMPDFYPAGEYDMAGFAVGVVEKSRIITGKNIRPGDMVIGLASSGLHSNGYSLARKVFFDKAKMRPNQHIPEFAASLGEELLKPTRIYSKPIKDVLVHYRVKRAVKGIANITGGGMIENIPRILPANVSIEIETGSWQRPPVFTLIQKLGNVSNDEMYRVFNMGIGLVVVVDPFYTGAVIQRLKSAGETPYLIGRVKRGNKEVVIR